MHAFTYALTVSYYYIGSGDLLLSTGGFPIKLSYEEGCPDIYLSASAEAGEERECRGEQNETSHL